MLLAMSSKKPYPRALDTAGVQKHLRQAALRASLNSRRLELTADVHDRLRERREIGVQSGGDVVEGSDAAVEANLQLALLEMRAQTLTNVDQAIARLDAGTYGSCFECDEDIAEARLLALPFAVRCRDCQEKRERRAAPRRSGTTGTVRFGPEIQTAG